MNQRNLSRKKIVIFIAEGKLNIQVLYVIKDIYLYIYIIEIEYFDGRHNLEFYGQRF